MRKVSLILLISLVVLLQFCTSSKKASSKSTSSTQPGKISYVGNVQPLITANCGPCHLPPNGTKKLYNAYEPVKGDIDNIISRIQKNPGDRGFMPFKHPKLSDSTINVFVQWKNEGLSEK